MRRASPCRASHWPRQCRWGSCPADWFERLPADLGDLMDELGDLAGSGIELEERRAMVRRVRRAGEVHVAVRRQSNSLPLAIQLALVGVQRKCADRQLRRDGRLRIGGPAPAWSREGGERGKESGRESPPRRGRGPGT